MNVTSVCVCCELAILTTKQRERNHDTLLVFVSNFTLGSICSNTCCNFSAVSWSNVLYVTDHKYVGDQAVQYLHCQLLPDIVQAYLMVNYIKLLELRNFYFDTCSTYWLPRYWMKLINYLIWSLRNHSMIFSRPFRKKGELTFFQLQWPKRFVDRKAILLPFLWTRETKVLKHHVESSDWCPIFATWFDNYFIYSWDTAIEDSLSYNSIYCNEFVVYLFF